MFEPGVFYCKDAFEGLSVMDRLIEPDAREQMLSELREGARAFREKGDEPVQQGTWPTTPCARPRERVPVPEPPFRGVLRDRRRPLDRVYPHLDTHVLFKLHWGGRGVKGQAWGNSLRDDFRPRLERMWREQDYLHPRALLGFFPCYLLLGNDIIVLAPRGTARRS